MTFESIYLLQQLNFTQTEVNPSPVQNKFYTLQHPETRMRLGFIINISD